MNSGSDDPKDVNEFDTKTNAYHYALAVNPDWRETSGALGMD